jgi:hypothetical protein
MSIRRGLCPSLLPLLLGALGLGLACGAQADCHSGALAGQQRDVATIQRLEHAWSVAYLSGDVEFERCLLTADFTEIMRDGSVRGLRDELALAERNHGRSAARVSLPPGEVLMHGAVAVAYGVSPPGAAPGSPRATRYADYYVWQDGGWRVFFAQQTPLSVP